MNGDTAPEGGGLSCREKLFLQGNRLDELKGSCGIISLSREIYKISGHRSE